MCYGAPNGSKLDSQQRNAYPPFPARRSIPNTTRIHPGDHCLPCPRRILKMVSTSSSPRYDETRHGGLETLPCDDPEAVPTVGLETVPGDGPEIVPCNDLETVPGNGPEIVPGNGPEIVPCNNLETVPCNDLEPLPCSGLEIAIGDSPETVSGGYSEILTSDGPPKERVPKVWWRLPLSLGHPHMFTRFVTEKENRAAGFWSSQKYLVSAIVVLVVVIAAVAGVAAGILRRKGNGSKIRLVESTSPFF